MAPVPGIRSSPGGKLHGAAYHELAGAFGAVGIRVSQAAKLKAALQEGYAALRCGRTVILDVLVEA